MREISDRFNQSPMSTVSRVSSHIQDISPHAAPLKKSDVLKIQPQDNQSIPSKAVSLTPGSEFIVDSQIHGLDVQSLVNADPVVSTIFELANKYHVPVGTWGGTTRDLILQRERSAISDIDIVYDSSHPNFSEFRTELEALAQQLKEAGQNVRIDYAVDMNPAKKQFIPRLTRRGETMSKAAIMNDGTVYDPTHMALSDIQNRVIRWHSFDGQAPGISYIFRIMKFKARYADFTFDPQTAQLIKDIVHHEYGPDSPRTEAIRSYNRIFRATLEHPEQPIPEDILTKAYHQFKKSGRTENGGTYLDFTRNIKKTIKNAQDPVGLLKLYQEYGLVDWLKSIDSLQELQPLIEQAQKMAPQETLQYDLVGSIKILNRKAQLENMKTVLDKLGSKLGPEMAQICKLKAQNLSHFSYDAPSSLQDNIVKYIEPELLQRNIPLETVYQLLDDLVLTSHLDKKIVRELAFEDASSLLPQKTIATTQAKLTTGFAPDVKGLDTEVPHSMKNVTEYVNERFGEMVLKDIIQNDVPVEIHQGNEGDAFQSLRQRGFNKLIQISTPKALSHKRLYLALNEQTGQRNYVLTQILGQDRLFHIQSQLKFAQVEGQRINDNNVTTYTHPTAHLKSIDATYRVNFGEHVPERVIIGFKNGLNREITRRAIFASQLRELQTQFGSHPLQGILAQLKADKSGIVDPAVDAQYNTVIEKLKNTGFAEVLELSSHDLFGSQESIVQFAQFTETLSQLASENSDVHLFNQVFVEGQLKAEGGLNLKGYQAAQPQHKPLLDHDLLTVYDGQGAKSEIMVTKPPYGDLAGNVGRVLTEKGANNILFLGTAGGLDPQGQIGDIMIPEKIYDAGNNLVGTRNDFLGFIKDNTGKKVLLFFNKEGVIKSSQLNGVQLDSKLLKVNSPMEETLDFIAQKRDAGYSALEVEISELAKVTGQQGAKFSSVQFISDIPGTEHTLEAHSNGGGVDQSFEKVVDLLIKYYGIEDMALHHPNKQSQNGLNISESKLKADMPFYWATEVADKLMADKTSHLNASEFTLCRNNMALYLLNGVREPELKKLSQKEGPLGLSDIKIDRRWQEKIERDLAAPFSNQDVFKQLDFLNAELKRMVTFIQNVGGKQTPYHLYILGSIAKGRPGANSDLDMIIDANDQTFLDKVYDSEFGFRGRTAESAIVVGEMSDHPAIKRHFFKPYTNIGDGTQVLENKNFLKGMYLETLQKKGIEISFSEKGEPKLALGENRFFKNSKEVPIAAEKLFELQKQYRSAMKHNGVWGKTVLEAGPGIALGMISILGLEKVADIGQLDAKDHPIARTGFVLGGAYVVNAGVSHLLTGKGFGFTMPHTIGGAVKGATVGTINTAGTLVTGMMPGLLASKLFGNVATALGFKEDSAVTKYGGFAAFFIPDFTRTLHKNYLNKMQAQGLANSGGVKVMGGVGKIFKVAAIANAVGLGVDLGTMAIDNLNDKSEYNRSIDYRAHELYEKHLKELIAQDSYKTQAKGVLGLGMEDTMDFLAPYFSTVITPEEFKQQIREQDKLYFQKTVTAIRHYLARVLLDSVQSDDAAQSAHFQPSKTNIERLQQALNEPELKDALADLQFIDLPEMKTEIAPLFSDLQSPTSQEQLINWLLNIRND